MPSPNDPLAHEVVELVRELLHALLASSMPAWMDLQLTVPQLRAVFVIAHNQSSSVTQIAQQLGIGEPTASHLIDRLVRAGLAERAEDPEDRRRMKVKLAPAGQVLIEKLLGWEEMLGGRLDQLSRRDLSSLRQGLEAVVEELPGEGPVRRKAPQKEN